MMRERKYTVGFIICCSLWLAAPVLAAEACSVDQLTLEPDWISTIEYDGTRNELLIADPKSRSLFSYHVKSGSMEKVEVNVSPVTVTKIQGGFFVQSEKQAAIVTTDRKAKTVELREAKATKKGATQLGSLYSNWVTRGSGFLGFGSVYGEASEASDQAAMRGFKLGFVTGTVSANSQKFENIRLIEATDNNEFYLLGLPYFAASDAGFFYVRMIRNEEASIRWIQPNGKIKNIPIPEGFRATRPLKEVGKESNAATVYHTVADRAMPYGLFSQGKQLYLLTRQPNPSGDGTQWLLHQVDPRKSEFGNVIRLPTTAEHLSVAVGADEWYFVERGHVREWGNQDINTIIRVPQSWIAPPPRTISPLDVSKRPVTCPRRISAL